MTETNRAVDHAVHEQTAEDEPYAQTPPVRVRGSLADGADDATTLTQRSLARVKKRWGKPITEPAPEAAGRADGQAGRWQDIAHQIHLWRDPQPSLRAIWNDLRTGAEPVREAAPGLMFVYWPLGICGFGLAAVFVFGIAVCARPGRLAAFTAFALLMWAAAAIAGINPI